MQQVANIWIWVGFTLFLIIALSFDTFIITRYRDRHRNTIQTALGWTLFWVMLALSFNLLLWFYLRRTTDTVFANARAIEFFTGYLIEKSLSVDNLFAFYMVFEHFRIPVKYQQRVFSYGIWGAIILRLVFILIGSWLLGMFHWLIYVMGAFLLLTGIKMFFVSENEKDLTETFVLRLSKRIFRVTSEFDKEHFFILKNKLYYATPLFIALIFIEFSDVVFAFDSIPAIFAITRDPFIIWSSNIFAILGLRSLYFVLAQMIDKFTLLKHGIALILVFIGTKMMLEPWLHISVGVSLSVIISIIIVFSILSVRYTKKLRR